MTRLGRALPWLQVVLTLLLLGVLEYGARWYCREKGDALERASLLLEADVDLGWRQRPRLSESFIGRPVHTNAFGLRAPELSRFEDGAIVILGPSSTFGWGVADDETYASLLDSRFRPRTGAPVVLNAGEIGYSTFQGIRLVSRPEISQLGWRALVVAYGVNDADHVRFFDATALPDSKEYAGRKPALRVRLVNGLSRARVLDLTRRRLQRWLFGHACAPRVVSNVRVDVDELEQNLRTLALTAIRRGVPVLFLGTAFRYAEKPGHSAEDVDAGQRLLENARAALREGRFLAARDAAQESVRHDGDVDEAWYVLAASESNLGQCAESRKAFAQAREKEPYRLARVLAERNEIMRRVATSIGAKYLDVQRLLASGDLAATLLDPIHPSALGHAMIAEAAAKELEALGLHP